MKVELQFWISSYLSRFWTSWKVYIFLIVGKFFKCLLLSLFNIHTAFSHSQLLKNIGRIFPSYDYQPILTSSQLPILYRFGWVLNQLFFFGWIFPLNDKNKSNVTHTKDFCEKKKCTKVARFKGRKNNSEITIFRQ